MATAFDRSAFDRVTDPIFQLFTPEQARAIVNYRGDDDLAERAEELARKCNEGDLSEGERAEYEAYARANSFISIMQAKARRLLNHS